MADLANLRIAVDSRDVRTADQDLENMGAAAAGAENNVRSLGATSRTTGAAMRDMTNIIQQGEQAQIAAANANRAVGQTGQLARHHMMNLGFQFQDLGVQIASGANPLTAFIQQGAQIAGVMAQAQIGIGGVIRALGSMVAAATMAIVTNPILMAIAAAAGTVALAFNFMADDISAASGVSVQASDVMLGAFDVVRNFLATQVTAAFAYFGTTAGEVWNTVVQYTRKAVNIIIGIVSLIPRAFVEAFKTVPVAIEKLLSGDLTGAMEVLGKSMGKITGDTFGRDYIGEVGVALKSAAVNRANIRIAEEAGKKLGKKTGSGIAKGMADPSKEFQDALDSLIAEKSKIGLSPEQIKMLEIEAVAAKAAAKGYDELAKKILEAGKALIEANAAFAASEKRKEANKDIDETIKALENEYKLLGLTGEARDRAALALEREGFIAKYEAALGIDAATAAWERYYAAKEKIISGESALAKEAKQAEKLKDTFNQLINLTDRLFGGAGSFLVNLGKDIKIVAPDFIKSLENVFEGFLGALPTVLANARIGMAVGGGTGGAVGGMIGGALGKKFLGDALGSLGTKIGGDVFGKALGSLAGPLGSIAGGLLGGLVGGLLKKTKTGSATISQIAGGAMQKTLSGNNAQLKGVADKLAGGLLKGLGDIAEQLGGTLGGAVKLSIGQRNKNFVVDPTGAGRTKGSGVMNFGQDQAAAVAYVTQLAIQQGIVTGISAGAQALIRAGDDLNAQVQKALKFDQVFKDLLKETDPLNASVSELSAEMEKLKVIFKEAGATAEDYAKLEELFAIRQAKAIFEANKPRRELEIQLMEAQGEAAGALAARRQLELDSMDANLRALQQQVWAAEDAAKATQELADANAKAAEEAAAAVEALRVLAVERRSLEIDLMEALGNSSEALAARREMELEAMDASLRGLQSQIWAALDAKKAAEDAAAAGKALAEQQADALEAANKLASDRRELEIQLLEAQGFAIEALAARRQIELEATDATLRGLKEQIWAAQAKAEADIAAAKAAEDAAAAEARAAEDAANAMQKYMDTLADVTKTVTDEINRLRGINASSTSVLLKAQFATLTAQARTGNLDALAKLPELSRSIEEATIGSATSALEVARIRAWLSSSLGETLAAQAASNAEINTAGAGLIFDGNQTTTASSSAQTADALSNMRSEMHNMMYQIAKNTGKSFELMDRWDGDGLPDIREDASDYY